MKWAMTPCKPSKPKKWNKYIKKYEYLAVSLFPCIRIRWIWNLDYPYLGPHSIPLPCKFCWQIYYVLIGRLAKCTWCQIWLELYAWISVSESKLLRGEGMDYCQIFALQGHLTISTANQNEINIKNCYWRRTLDSAHEDHYFKVQQHRLIDWMNEAISRSQFYFKKIVLENNRRPIY